MIFELTYIIIRISFHYDIIDDNDTFIKPGKGDRLPRRGVYPPSPGLRGLLGERGNSGPPSGAPQGLRTASRITPHVDP